MKKLFMIVSTPFWIVNVDSVPQLSLRVQELKQLQRQCAEFERTTAGETNARGLDFSRQLRAPALFNIDDVPLPQRGLSLFAEISELKDLELVPARNSLSSKSAQLGLPAAEAQIATHDGATFLKVAGLDLACDLINQKMQIKAVAPLHAGPASESILKLNEKLTRIEKTILEIRREPNFKVAAALLGYRFTSEELKLTFNQLLDKKTLALTDNWETFGGVAAIRYEKRKDAGFSRVLLSVLSENEKEIRETEQKLDTFAGLEFQDFTPAQKAEFTRLNAFKARLLQKLILQKIQRRQYVF